MFSRFVWLLAVVSLLAGISATPGTGAVVRTETHFGITCQWRTAQGGAAVCQRADRIGYVVWVTQRVAAVETARFKVIFEHTQPVKSKGFQNVVDNRVVLRVTHARVTCEWTTLAGGGVLCHKADKHGYIVGVSRELVTVTYENTRVSYNAKQP